ncbi:MAG: ATP-binding protein [Acidimicrobiia bacterium]
MVIEGIIGHEGALRTLGAEVDRPANSYLFVGASGIGKATVARRLAAALLCPTMGDHEEACSSCRRVGNGNHPDLTVVEPEARQALGVAEARATVAQAVLAPMEAARKVFLFEEAGNMTDQAANALLKTLEEPTATTVFLLCAESEEDLPATVGSRCRTIHFGRVEEEVIVDGLLRRGVGREQAGGAARIAGGRPGLALDLVRRAEVADYRRAWLSVPLEASARPGDVFRLAEQMMAAVEPLLIGIRDRHATEEDGSGGSRTARERQERELKRKSQALLVAGLEIVASWYADAASVQHGGPARNSDVPVASLTSVSPRAAVRKAGRVLDAITELQAGQRPTLVLASLFAELGDEG